MIQGNDQRQVKFEGKTKYIYKFVVLSLGLSWKILKRNFEFPSFTNSSSRYLGPKTCITNDYPTTKQIVSV